MLPMKFLTPFGKPRVNQNFREERWGTYDQTYRVNMYFTINYGCPNGCSFCRNHELAKNDSSYNLERQIEQLRKWSPHVHTITIGGGEPLVHINAIMKLVKDRQLSYTNCTIASRSVAIVTSGIRRIFIEEAKAAYNYYSNYDFLWSDSDKPSLFNFISIIYLSRLSADDRKNQELFNTREDILKSSDIRNLPSYIRNKITILTTCCKNGVNTLESMIDFIHWAKKVKINSIVFNDLQKSVSGETWKEDNISPKLFEEFETFLKKNGYSLKTHICYSGGYDIKSFTDGYLTVGLKHYHADKDETIAKWKSIRKRTYDLALLPSGEIQFDTI